MHNEYVNKSAERVFENPIVRITSLFNFIYLILSNPNF